MKDVKTNIKKDTKKQKSRFLKMRIASNKMHKLNTYNLHCGDIFSWKSICCITDQETSFTNSPGRKEINVTQYDIFFN